MLSPDQVASQGPGGFLNLNGGATDPYYAQADGSAYPDDATACAAVPTAARRNRTVNVAGVEKWWKESNLSDAGLLAKSTGGGSGSPGADYVSTETLGGVSAGDIFTTSDSAVVKMLVKYQRPTFPVFTLAGKGTQTVVVGTVFPAGLKSVDWATTNDVNIKPASIAVRDVTANTILASNEQNDGAASVSTASFTAVLGQSRVYLISGVDTQNNTFFSTITISGLFESYFGYLDTNGVLDVATLRSLGNNELQSGKGRTVSGVTAGIGLYVVYAWPSTGADDIDQVYQDGVDSIRGAFGPVRYATGQNALGATVTLGYIISNAPRAFTNSTLTFK